MNLFEAIAAVGARLERALADPAFMGASIGATLDDFLSAYVVREVRPGRRDALATGFRYARDLLLGAAGSGGSRFGGTGSVLIASASRRRTLLETVPRLVNALRPRRACLLGDVESWAGLPPATEVMRWEDQPSLDVGQWRREYRRCAAAWHRALRGVVHEGVLPRELLPRLRHVLLVQSQRVASAHALLARVRPSIVLAEYDRNARQAPLVLAARARGVPTATLVHGVLNGPFGYTPVLADSVLCWGERQRDQFIELGTARERLVITGCPHLSRELPTPGETVRARLGLATDRRLVVLATNPLPPRDRLRFAEEFCRAVVDLRVQPVIRLHPSERLEWYRDIAARFPTVRISPASEATADEMIAAADLVIVHSSGFGSDALVKRRLVVVLDALELPLGHGQELVERAGVPSARTSAELRRLISELVIDPDGLRPVVEARREAWVASFCAAFGQEAVERTANVLAQRVRLAA